MQKNYDIALKAKKMLIGNEFSILHSQFSIKCITFATALEQSVLWKTADMAQLVEQRIRNAWVAGSSPAIGSLSSGVRISTF